MYFVRLHPLPCERIQVCKTQYQIAFECLLSFVLFNSYAAKFIHIPAQNFQHYISCIALIEVSLRGPNREQSNLFRRPVHERSMIP